MMLMVPVELNKDITRPTKEIIIIVNLSRLHLAPQEEVIWGQRELKTGHIQVEPMHRS